MLQVWRFIFIFILIAKRDINMRDIEKKKSLGTSWKVCEQDDKSKTKRTHPKQKVNLNNLI